MNALLPLFSRLSEPSEENLENVFQSLHQLLASNQTSPAAIRNAFDSHWMPNLGKMRESSAENVHILFIRCYALILEGLGSGTPRVHSRSFRSNISSLCILSVKI